jgi:hypothetical protein
VWIGELKLEVVTKEFDSAKLSVARDIDHRFRTVGFPARSGERQAIRLDLGQDFAFRVREAGEAHPIAHGIRYADFALDPPPDDPDGAIGR